MHSEHAIKSIKQNSYLLELQPSIEIFHLSLGSLPSQNPINLNVIVYNVVPTHWLLHNIWLKTYRQTQKRIEIIQQHVVTGK